ncbi:MAG: hypothetical protein U0525_00145 [Patescibacteria group bacterium]
MMQQLVQNGLVLLSVFVLNMSFLAESAHYGLRNLAWNLSGTARQYASSPTLIPQSFAQKDNNASGEASPSSVKTVQTESWSPLPTIPWGTTEKVGDHTYRTYVGDDPVMSTPEELEQAINKYRVTHDLSELPISDPLCRLADYRIKQLEAINGLDSHKGFEDYLDEDENWQNLPRFVSVGENNSYGYQLSGTHLIEWVFDADEEHRSNQLNPKWNRMCTRISGTIVEIVFGQEM